MTVKRAWQSHTWTGKTDLLLVAIITLLVIGNAVQSISAAADSQKRKTQRISVEQRVAMLQQQQQREPRGEADRLARTNELTLARMDERLNNMGEDMTEFRAMMHRLDQKVDRVVDNTRNAEHPLSVDIILTLIGAFIAAERGLSFYRTAKDK